MRTFSISPSALLALIALLVPMGSVLSQPATMTWPDAVAQLTAERTRAETCVAVLKRYGTKEQVGRGELSYTNANAKADADAVIAGLVTALSAGQEPASLSSLQATLNSGVSRLAEFCNTVGALVPNTAGQKGGLAGILTAIVQSPGAIEQLLKMLSAGVSTLYTNYRTDDALTRATIKTQLEAARWPAFSEVKAAD
jgi:hypothetical protein